MKNYIKRTYKQVMAFVLSISIMSGPVFLLSVKAQELDKMLYSSGAVLMDADSGRMLFSKNADIPYAMASTTKIMTCILALELGSLEQIVTISENAASMPDVQMNAAAGEQYYLRDLLYSTMLESHNDSAVAVAEAIGGSIEHFTKLMDRKAEAIGCEKTNFVTPNGLDGADEEGEHQTTAKELAMILRYCIHISSKAKEFLELTGTSDYQFQEINGKRSVSCRNHNALLEMYEGTFTGKTGFTSKAGYCYTGAAKNDEKTMIIALLGAGGYPNRSYKWKDAIKLLNYGFENYEYRTIGKEKWEIKKIPVNDGMEKEAILFTDAVPFQYLLGDEEKVVCNIKMAQQLQAPVRKNQVIGTISYELNGMVIEQFNIYTGQNIEKNTFWNILKMWLRNIQDFVSNLTNK